MSCSPLLGFVGDAVFSWRHRYRSTGGGGAIAAGTFGQYSRTFAFPTPTLDQNTALYIEQVFLRATATPTAPTTDAFQCAGFTLVLRASDNTTLYPLADGSRLPDNPTVDVAVALQPRLILTWQDLCALYQLVNGNQTLLKQPLNVLLLASFKNVSPANAISPTIDCEIVYRIISGLRG